MENKLLKSRVLYDIKELREAVEKTVYFYNTARTHMSINLMILQRAVTHAGEIKKGWVGYRDIAINNLQAENIISNKCLSLGV